MGHIVTTQEEIIALLNTHDEMNLLSMNRFLLALGEIGVRKPSQEWIADGTNDHKYKGLKFISRLIKLMSPILV